MARVPRQWSRLHPGTLYFDHFVHTRSCLRYALNPTAQILHTEIQGLSPHAALNLACPVLDRQSPFLDACPADPECLALQLNPQHLHNNTMFPYSIFLQISLKAEAFGLNQEPSTEAVLGQVGELSCSGRPAKGTSYATTAHPNRKPSCKSRFIDMFSLYQNKWGKLSTCKAASQSPGHDASSVT